METISTTQPVRSSRVATKRACARARALARLPEASAETRAAIDALSSGIVNKILHAPITKLRESSRAGASRSWLELVHELFALGRRG